MTLNFKQRFFLLKNIIGQNIIICKTIPFILTHNVNLANMFWLAYYYVTLTFIWNIQSLSNIANGINNVNNIFIFFPCKYLNNRNVT